MQVCEGIKYGYDWVCKDFDQFLVDVNVYVCDNLGCLIFIVVGVGFVFGFFLRGECCW